MSQSELNNDTARRLRGLLTEVGDAIAEALHSLVDTPVRSQTGELDLTSFDALQKEIDEPSVIVRGSLRNENKTVYFAIDPPTAATLAACMMMAPEEAIAERRSRKVLTDEDLESFGDVANVICSGADATLRERVDGHADLRFKDHKLLDLGSDPDSHLGKGDCLSYCFPITIKDYPESRMRIILDTETAEFWNEGPLDAVDHESDEEALEDIPRAPIRGTLATYVVDQEVLNTVRKACRRVGLELDRHPRSAIPNPAAHRGQFVLMDVPAGDERRFEWCKRLTEDESGIKTVLIIHHASRSRVLQGFMARATVILGWPMAETQLSQKLVELHGPPPVDGGDPE